MGNKPDSVWTSSQLINSLTNKAQVFIFAYSPEKKTLLAWSDNAVEILGVKDVDISRDGNLFLRHVHPDDRFVLLNDLEAALKEDTIYRATYRWIRPDNNELRWLHCRGKINKNDNDEPFFEGIILDLTSEFTGHIARIAGPDSLSTIIAAFPTMVFTLDKDLRIIRLNRPSSMNNFNFADPSFDAENFKIGRLFPTCFSSKNHNQYFLDDFFEIIENKKDYFKTRLENHSAESNESVYKLEAFPLKEKNLIEGLLVIVSDISDSVKLERDIAKLNRAEGLRLLTSGVSHNFNNSLQAIMGFASALRNSPENTELVLKSSQAIIDRVNRTSELARQLFTFEDSANPIITAVDVNLAVMAAAHKVEDLFSSGFKVAVAFGNPAPAIANHEKLVQAIVAIMKNARNNSSLNDSLTIRTMQVSVDSDQVQGLSKGNYAKIIISDSSHGKVAGISEAYAVAREFGGIVLIDSRKGQGTNVSIFLPIADEQFHIPSSATSLFEVPEEFKPDVLIIDDDLLVLETSKKIMESSNLKCLVAEDSKRAIELFKMYGTTLKLVLIDSLIPGVNGATLLRRIKKMNPEIKAIGFSGAAPEFSKQLIDAGVITVLTKPVDPTLLKSTVSAIVNAKEAA